MSPRLLIATHKGLFLARRGVLGWELMPPVFLGASVTFAVGDPRDGMLYAAIERRHAGPALHRSEDNGKTWQQVAAPIHPVSRSDDAREADRARAAPPSIWTLAPDPGMPGALWCGTVPGGLFHSEDRGDSWHLVRGLWDRPERARWTGGGKGAPGLHSICVDPRDPRVVTVAISCGGIWRSEDHGTTWTAIGDGLRAAHAPKASRERPEVSDPHLLVQCPAAPDRMWCQHRAGIFVSDDAGVRWRQVKGVRPSAFGFAVAAHPSDPDTAWFVPTMSDTCRVPVGARLVVIQTRDGGATFVRRATGLPAKSYDVVLRHGLDLAPDGRTLALGSSTGGLWLSENAGVRFECLSAHLPPIHAVRFAFASPLRPRQRPARKA